MPVSKTRKRGPSKLERSVHTRPALPADSGDPLLPAIETGLRAVLEVEQVLKAEPDNAKLQETHLNLRAGVLGLMVAHSMIHGLPDPRSFAQ